MNMNQEEIRKIVEGEHPDPFVVLGAHRNELGGKRSVVIRAFLPDAATVSVVDERHRARATAMTKIDPAGFFEAVFEGENDVFPYQLQTVDAAGLVETFRDSYSFLPTLTDFDLYLFNAGDHHRLYEKLGSHYAEVLGVGGVEFAVWAPNARSVSVIGDFNRWDRRKHAMRVLGSSGVWEIFVPGLPEGSLYKFQIKTRDGRILDKSDPFATEMEFRPRTASKVNYLGFDGWTDKQWMAARSSGNREALPISVYEVHLGSWMRHAYDGGRWMTYRELADKLVSYVIQRGFTHIELMPVMEHPYDASWGYQVTGYFAPTSRFGSPQDFMFFVNRCHEMNLGVILDWVPAHFPKDSHALAEFDGTHLYEHADPRQGEHQDWGTLIFNFGRNEVRNFLLSNALFWIDRYHVDGIRIDAVASMLYLDYSRQQGQWVPNRLGGRENLDAIDFLKRLNVLIEKYYPGVWSIAEESTAFPGVTAKAEAGGLNFGLKWNMGWMHDMLDYFSKDPIHRSHHHDRLTFALLYAFNERFLLPLSHDEVVHGKASLISKMPGDEWQQFANLRLLLGFMYGFPGKKLLFMGGEFGQRAEWNHEWELEWNVLQYPLHAGIQRWVDDVHRVYRSQRALFEVDFHYSGFEWVDFRDAASSVVSFERKSSDGRESIFVVCNFTPVPRYAYRIGVSEDGTYQEVLNSDSLHYGGSNLGNYGSIHADAVPFHDRPFSLSLTLPPLAALFLKRVL